MRKRFINPNRELLWVVCGSGNCFGSDHKGEPKTRRRTLSWLGEEIQDFAHEGWNRDQQLVVLDECHLVKVMCVVGVGKTNFENWGSNCKWKKDRQTYYGALDAQTKEFIAQSTVLEMERIQWLSLNIFKSKRPGRRLVLGMTVPQERGNESIFCGCQCKARGQCSRSGVHLVCAERAGSKTWSKMYGYKPKLSENTGYVNRLLWWWKLSQVLYSTTNALLSFLLGAVHQAFINHLGLLSGIKKWFRAKLT